MVSELEYLFQGLLKEADFQLSCRPARQNGQKGLVWNIYTFYPDKCYRTRINFSQEYSCK